MAVKLKDIAAKAGVSSTTCSLILNNKPISVSEETKQNVLRIALEMGYMRKQSIHNLGLMVPIGKPLLYRDHKKRIPQGSGSRL